MDLLLHTHQHTEVTITFSLSPSQWAALSSRILSHGLSGIQISFIRTSVQKESRHHPPWELRYSAHTHTHPPTTGLYVGQFWAVYFVVYLLSLHWLPVCHRVNLTILLLVFKPLNGLALPYLSDLLNEHRPVLFLWSSNQRLLCIPKAKLKCRGDRTFSVCSALCHFGGMLCPSVLNLHHHCLTF